MKDQISKYLQPIGDYWKGLSGKVKKIIIFSTIGCLIFAVGLGVILNNNPYSPLYTNISSAEASEVMAKLETLGVEYQVNNGIVEVKKDQADQVKMKLAVEGYPKSGLSYDVFTNNIDLMSTDFEKNSFKIFQLQDRLRDTIKLINGVEEAVVTIATPQQNNYVWKEDKEETTASVTLKTTSEGSVTEQQVKGIVQLVSKSIPGLKAENVAVVDTFGNDLVNEGISNNEVNLSQLKLDIERQIESSAKSKVLNVLVPIYGEKNINTSVKCIVDVRKKITESINYIPNGDTDKGVVEKEETNKESTSEKNEENKVPGTESNTQVPDYPIISDDGDKIYIKDQSSYQYLVSSIKEQVQSDASEQKDMTVAVAINKSDLSEYDKANIQKLVAAATAISPDKVVIHNTAFEGDNKSLSVGKGAVAVGVGASAIVLVLIILTVIILLFIRKSKLKKVEETNSDDYKNALFYNPEKSSISPLIEQLQEQSNNSNAQSGLKSLDDLDPTNQQQLQERLQDLSDKKPDVVARLLRSWLNGDEGKIE